MVEPEEKSCNMQLDCSSGPYNGQAVKATEHVYGYHTFQVFFFKDTDELYVKRSKKSKPARTRALARTLAWLDLALAGLRHPLS